MDSTGIGFNNEKINEVSNQLSESLKAIQKAMQDNWPTMINVFRNNWVGNDEQAFERNFASKLQIVYQNSGAIIASAQDFILETGLAWDCFQGNIASQFETNESSSSFPLPNLDVVNKATELELPDMGLVVPDMSVNRGLTSSGAEQNLIGAIDEYMLNIKNAYDALIQQIDASAAFIGQEQAPAMNKFIQGLIDNMTGVFSAVNEFKDVTIPQLVEAYRAQESTIAQDIGSASSTIGDSVSGTSAN